MRFITSSLIAVSCSLLSVTLALDEGKVVELSNDSFDKFIGAEKVALVEFFAPCTLATLVFINFGIGCGHCQKLAPEYAVAAEKLKGDGISLASVDCTKNQELCGKLQIRGYPTMKVFKGGIESEYKGARDSDGIINYMKKQLRPALSPLSINQLESFSQLDDVVIVANLPKGSKELDTLSKIAEGNRDDYTFGVVEAPSVVMFKKFDEGLSKYEGDFSEDSLTKWLKTESIPLMAEIGQDNYERYMSAGVPLAFLFYGSEDQRKDVGGVVEKVMKNYKGAVNAVYIDATKFAAYGESLNLEKEWPGFVIHDIENDLKYPFPPKEKITEAALSKFMQTFASGDLKPKYKSEPIPAADSGPVKIIVHETFEKIVMDEKKDVLIELYAPWCGACKRIAPTYEKLAKLYEKHKDKIVIAKMDGTTNDLPKSAKIKLEKFPTLFLFKAGTNEKIELEHPSDNMNVFVDFISKHATNKVSVEVPKDEPSAAAAEEHEEL